MSIKKKLIETEDYVVIVVEAGHHLLDDSYEFTEGNVYQVLEGQDTAEDKYILLENDIGDEWWVSINAVVPYKPIKKIYAKELD